MSTRIYAMASQAENAAIAVLQSQMKSALEGIATINNKLDTQSGLYVTQAEFQEFKRRWFLSHTMAALAGSIITGVAIYALTHFGK